MSEKMGKPEDYGVPDKIFGLPVRMVERTEKEMALGLAYPWWMLPRDFDQEDLKKARRKLFREMRRMSFKTNMGWWIFKIRMFFKRLWYILFPKKDGDHE